MHMKFQLNLAKHHNIWTWVPPPLFFGYKTLQTKGQGVTLLSKKKKKKWNKNKTLVSQNILMFLDLAKMCHILIKLELKMHTL